MKDTDERSMSEKIRESVEAEQAAARLAALAPRSGRVTRIGSDRGHAAAVQARRRARVKAGAKSRSRNRR